MSDLVSFPAKYLGCEPALIDKQAFYVFKFIRPVYFDVAQMAFAIEQLPQEEPNFKKWVKDSDVAQFSILNALEIGKIHTLRWLASPSYDKESKKNKIGYTALPPAQPLSK